LFAAGDLNGDGKQDVLGVAPNGYLYRYLGKGDGNFWTRLKVGNGWSVYKLAAGASLDGDKYSDLVGVSPDWKLYFYRGLGGGAFGTSKQIGNGF
jgi:hypothetical protein